MSRLIISITGTSGSGKSTMGDIIKNRFKNVMVIDTDDIDDKSFIHLFETNQEFKQMIKTNTGEPQKIHEALNYVERDRIIKENPTKNIIFVGMTVGLDGIEHMGYFLDTPSELNFRRINQRTIRDICKKSTQLEKMYLEEDVEFTDLLSLYVFKIRQKFPVSFGAVKERIHKMREDYSAQNFKIMTGQQILTDLESHLQSSISKNAKSNIIIHVAGQQGSGKSYMGDKLQLYFGDLIYVKDLDELSGEFRSQDLTDYQSFIDDFIIKHRDKLIIFTGLDAEMCLGAQKESDEDFYILHANHKFFIDLSDPELLRQRFYRQVQKLSDRKDFLFKEWQKDPKSIQEKIIRYIDISSWQKNNKHCESHYRNRGYEMMSYELIFNKICDIIRS